MSASLDFPAASCGRSQNIDSLACHRANDQNAPSNRPARFFVKDTQSPSLIVDNPGLGRAHPGRGTTRRVACLGKTDHSSGTC